MGQVEALKSTLEALELGAVAELEATAGVKPAGWASTQNFATAVAGGHKGTGPAVVRLAHAVCGCATTDPAPDDPAPDDHHPTTTLGACGIAASHRAVDSRRSADPGRERVAS